MTRLSSFSTSYSKREIRPDKQPLFLCWKTFKIKDGIFFMKHQDLAAVKRMVALSCLFICVTDLECSHMQICTVKSYKTCFMWTFLTAVSKDLTHQQQMWFCNISIPLYDEFFFKKERKFPLFYPHSLICKRIWIVDLSITDI